MSMGGVRDWPEKPWLATGPMRTPGWTVFDRRNRVLSDHDLDRKAEALCGPCDADRDVRPSIPQGVDLRMAMVGGFEGISPQRRLAGRCQDSFALKNFLGLGPAEAAPDPSSLSGIGRRLPIEVHRAVRELVVEILEGSGLLKGQALAIEAMRSIVRRDRTCISEPMQHGCRRLSLKPPLARKALDRKRHGVRIAPGKKLLRRRGETVERTSAHALGTGRMRRAWLRGRNSVEKRDWMQVRACHLGLSMWELGGFGTPKGLVGARAALLAVLVGLGLALAGAWRRALRCHHLAWFTSKVRFTYPHRALLSHGATS
jgi:hypothetical protein